MDRTSTLVRLSRWLAAVSLVTVAPLAASVFQQPPDAPAALFGRRVVDAVDGSPRGHVDLMLVLTADSGNTSAREAAAQAVRVRLELDKPVFLLGENVLMHYCVENGRPWPALIEVGGDYRAASRSLRFKVTVTNPRGEVMSDPDPSGFGFGGVSLKPMIEPGGRWCQSLPLVRYARIEDPGAYTIAVVHDLGWPEGTAPAGRAEIVFTRPTPAEAEAVVAAMERMVPVPGARMGTRSEPYRDYTSLRYKEYFEPLTVRARAGSAEAVFGVGAIPVPAATRELIDLLGSPAAEVASAAAQQLAMRLPDPALDGALPSRGPFVNELEDPRRYLRDRSWRPAFAADVRSAARRLLASSELPNVISGAFMLQAVGAAPDAPALAVALDAALERTLTLPFEAHRYPRPRGAMRELMRTATALVNRGYRSSRTPASPGEAAIALKAIELGSRAAGWRDVLDAALAHRIPHLRELALESLPVDEAASLIEAVRANLGHADVDVRIAACRLAGRARLTDLRAAVEEIARTATEPWLANAATNALGLVASRSEMLELVATRLADPDRFGEAMGYLTGVFQHDGAGGSGGTHDAGQAAALVERWLEFIASRRADIDAGRRISLDEPGLPTDLVPPGYSLHRRGKPDWPPRTGGTDPS